MRVRGLSCIILLAAALAGCGDSAGPEKDEYFILAVMVTDTGGQPMAGMKVGRLNDLDGFDVPWTRQPGPGDLPSLSDTLIVSYPNPFNGVAVVRFSTVDTRDALLDVIDWRGRKVKTLLYGRLQAGLHSIVWDQRDETGHRVINGVYRVSLSLADTLESPEYTFADSIDCTVFDSLDPYRTEMGETDQTGFFSTRDLDLFPSLQGHGPQDAYDATATYLGTFSFSDTVTIRVSTPPPPGAGKIYHMSCETALVNGPNYLEFAFVPDDSTEVPITSVR